MLYFPFVRWSRWHLSRKQLIKFLFWFWHRKNDTRLYSNTSLLCLSYKITHHLLNAHELEYASFYHCRKWSPILFVVKNWYSVLIETINKSVKSVFRQRMLNYSTGFRATTRLCRVKIYSQNCQDILFCFLLILKRQCIRVWLCKLVRCANKWSYRYCILSLDI